MTKGEILHVIRENVLEILEDIPPETISTDKRLKDLGANSVDRAEIVAMTMERLDIRVPLVELGQVKSIGGLIDFLFDKKKTADP
jgi:polyketide biosynthesis acyl carrier protein